MTGMSWSSKTVPKYYHNVIWRIHKSQLPEAMQFEATEIKRLVHPCAWTLLARCLIRVVFWNVKISHRGIYWLLRRKGLGTPINGGYISCRSNDFHLATPFAMTTKCIKHETFINLLRSFAWAFAKRSAVLCNSLGTEQCPKTGSLSTCHCYRKGGIKKQI